MLSKRTEARFHCAIKVFLNRADQGRVMGVLRDLFCRPASGEMNDVPVYTADAWPGKAFVEAEVYQAAMARVAELEAMQEFMAKSQMAEIVHQLIRHQGKPHSKILGLLWACADINDDLYRGRGLDHGIYKAGRKLAELQGKQETPSCPD